MSKSASGAKEEPGRSVAANRGLNRAIVRMAHGELRRFLTSNAGRVGKRPESSQNNPRSTQVIARILSGSLVLILLSSCGVNPDVTATIIDTNAFFPIVYYAVTSRDIGGSTWVAVQGLYEIQVISNSDNASGTFTFHYTSYLEPQYCTTGKSCICSGGAAGNFTIPGAGDGATTDQPYNPLDPYIADGGTGTQIAGSQNTTDPLTGQPTTAIIYSFTFAITITDRNLTSGCKPEADRTIQMLRFSDGSIVMTNSYRELYLTPETQ